MPEQEYVDKVYLALLEAHDEHDGLAKRYMTKLRELQEDHTVQKWILDDCEEAFHLHNCITAVLRDILYAGEEAPQLEDPSPF